jgi:hypothetical protein
MLRRFRVFAHRLMESSANQSSDMPILIEHFLRDAQKKLTRSRKHRIDADAISALSAYTWALDGADPYDDRPDRLGVANFTNTYIATIATSDSPANPLNSPLQYQSLDVNDQFEMYVSISLVIPIFLI